MPRYRLLTLLLVVSSLSGILATNGRHLLASDGPPITIQDEEFDMLDAFWDSAYTVDVLQTSDYSPVLLAKAQADECFVEVGSGEFLVPPCDRGVPKVNDTRIWSLTQSNGKIWFGIAANDLCLISDQLYLNPFSGPDPKLTSGYVCEYGESNFSPPLIATLGDWRAPKVYMYDPDTHTLVDKTPPSTDPWINNTLGLRAAGSVSNVVFLAGPSLGPFNTGWVDINGLNVFAYDGLTGEYLGSTHYDNYGDIRETVVVDDVLYTAVQNTAANNPANGTILRWDAQNPLEFVPVGKVEGLGAYLTVHDNRLFVATWPTQIYSACEVDFPTWDCPLASIFMSPEIPAGGLTSDHYDEWVSIWDVSAYEPDESTAKSYGMGPIFSFDGYLWWTTMHVLNKAQTVHLLARAAAGDIVTDPAEINKISLGVTRATSMFRLQAVDGVYDGANTELVYGMEQLPVYDFDAQAWNLVPTGMGPALFGPSGYGNFYTNYSWSTALYNGSLYLGTMDWSHLAQFNFPVPDPDGPNCPEQPEDAPPFDCGADIYRFDSADQPAQIVTSNGFGNYTNHGARTMLTGPYGLYVGSTNSMNLLTSITDGLPEGGWELRRIASFVPVSQFYLPVIRR